jgi:4-amino-4-deoxy-L-arabinose transferase-like glycosyltransferase
VVDVAAPAAPVAAEEERVPRSARRFGLLLAAIVVGGLLVRVAYVYFYRRHTFYLGDPLYYHGAAYLLAHGHGFWNPWAYEQHRYVQAADHPPLYILYLAAVAVVGVQSVTGMVFASTLLGAASVGVAGLAGREMGGERQGLIAAVLVALYPNTWRYDGMLLSESMVILVVLVTIWLAYRYWHRPSRWRMAAVGAAVGLAALSRSELILLALLLVVPLALLTPRASRRRRARRLGIGLVSCGLVIAPWVGFNLVRFDHTVLLSQNVGGTMATANCRRVYYGELIGYWYFPCGTTILNAHHLDALDSRADSTMFNGAVKYVEQHKARVPLVVAARLGRITGLFKPASTAQLDVFLENATPWVSTAGLWTYYPMALLAIAGGFVLRRRGEVLFPVLAPIFGVLITAAVFYAATRFRAAAEPALCLLAAAALDAAYVAWQRRRANRPEHAVAEVVPA